MPCLSRRSIISPQLFTDRTTIVMNASKSGSNISGFLPPDTSIERFSISACMNFLYAAPSVESTP